MTGIILYEGPSMIDGAPIVVVATGSTNRKTGGMLQTWIIRADVEPHEARKTGQDASICGDCPHRAGSCYVVLHQAPLSVFRAYKRGSYRTAGDLQTIAAVGKGKAVRLGSYGDPAAVPVEVWEALVSEAASHTGYTHQWRKVPSLRTFCMASCDTEADRLEAKANGWRTFRVRAADAPLMDREITCPASAEGGSRTTCDRCGLCAGLRKWSGKDVAIIVHGAAAKVNAYQRTFAA